MPSKKYPFLDEKQLGLVYETQRNHYRKNKDEIIRKNKERRDRYTKEKRYECELCKKAFGSKYRLDQHMNTKNHIMGTAIMNTKSSTGNTGAIKNHNTVNTAAKMPHTTVAKLFPMYPINIH